MVKGTGKKVIALFAVVMLLLMNVGCEEQIDCQLSTETPLRAGFYTMVNDTLELDTSTAVLSVIGLGQSDSILASAGEQLSFNLPLNPFVDSSAFIMIFDGIHDTLSIRYNRRLQLLSEECGFITKFELSSVSSTHNHIDSLYIIEDNVDTENVRHLKIYL